MPKVKRAPKNGSEMATMVTLIEGGKISISRAQVLQVQRIIFAIQRKFPETLGFSMRIGERSLRDRDDV